ncbi:MBL fold metallo-hydrolase [Phenylobacterium sp.]|uniref:MBL fold metallo-hydrolase n=1 Tax=Phenylobacterium sp. TaxID=1871053 RepID=UPI0025D87225|nr:MBL fold metallo-hydrolase [Phenylobacterium sp.]
MSDLRLTVHRSTQEIGGNCIEIATEEGRVILDIGRPLDAPKEATGLLPETLDLKRPMDGILVSHPHQDHYGLLPEAPADWPVYCGEPTARLIELTSGIFGKPIQRDFRHWKSGQDIQVGPFRVRPYLTDHSAFDAHMLLLEGAGKRILYSGDFRAHGRKSKLVERLMASPPHDIDVLLMEGTNLGSDKPCVTEDALEDEFEALFRETAGRVFVTWSAQNVDRTVTLYRACKKTRRALVVDLYTAEVLEKLGAFAKLPQPGWPNLKVVITSNFSRLYLGKGEGEFVDRMAKHGISARALAESPEKWVIMTRSSLIESYRNAGVVPTTTDAWSWSMWRGYLPTSDGQTAQTWFNEGGARAAHIHTSGHASTADLRAFAQSTKARTLVPIHGLAWDGDIAGFPPIRRLADGETMVV